MKKTPLALALALSAALLSACGGSSGSSNNQQVVRGTIDGFGSVIVAGVRYHTDSAAFKVKEISGSQDDLRVGQVVTLLVDSKHNASQVIYDLSLEGPVSAVNADGSFVVLGQKVVVNDLTVFEDLVSADLKQGMRVEISGYLQASGELVATHVEKDHDTDGKVELRGAVSELNESAKTFQLRGQQIDYSGVHKWDLEGAALANGLLVEVEGQLKDEVLNARKIEAEDEDFEPDTELKLTGLISGMDVSAKTFVLNGLTVRIDKHTELDGNLSLESLINGVLVKVEGHINAQGELVAEEIDVKAQSSISLTATVEALSAGADNFSGTLTVLGGLKVKVDMNTRIRDDGNNKNKDKFFNFSQLKVGDQVDLKLAADKTSGYRVLRLERDNDVDDAGKIELKVPASVINLQDKTILGVAFTSALTLPASLPAQAKIKIEGQFNGSLIITKFEIELDHDD